MAKIDPFYLFLSYFSAAMLLAPVFFGLLRLKYLTKNYLFVFILVSVSLIIEIISYTMIKYFNSSNIFLYNVYMIIETLLISAFYYSYLEKKSLKLTILIIATLFITASSIELIMQKKNTMSEIFLTFESLFTISLAVITFHQILQKQIYSNILNAPILWINSSFLLFFAGNLFVFLFSKFLHEFAQKAFYEIWGFHSILNIILYTLISIGFWKTKTSQT